MNDECYVCEYCLLLCFVMVMNVTLCHTPLTPPSLLSPSLSLPPSLPPSLSLPHLSLSLLFSLSPLPSFSPTFSPPLTSFFSTSPCLGSYTDSRGITVIRKHVQDFITARDGIPANYENIYLTNGATDGIKVL